MIFFSYLCESLLHSWRPIAMTDGLAANTVITLSTMPYNGHDPCSGPNYSIQRHSICTHHCAHWISKILLYTAVRRSSAHTSPPVQLLRTSGLPHEDTADTRTNICNREMGMASHGDQDLLVTHDLGNCTDASWASLDHPMTCLLEAMPHHYKCGRKGHW